MKISYFSCLAVCITSMLLTFSCSTLDNIDTSSEMSDYTVKNGILHFKNLDVFLKTHKNLLKTDSKTRESFGKDQGFESQAALFTNVNSLLNKIEDKVAHDALLNHYSDVFSLNDGVVDYRVADRTITPFLNRQGIVVIGGVAYRFVDNKELMSTNGEIKDLLQVNPVLKNKTIRVFTTNESYISNPKGRAPISDPCGRLYSDLFNSNNDRRVLIYGDFAINVYSAGFERDRVVLNISTFARPLKRGAFGSWNTYTSSNTLETRYKFRLYTTKGINPLAGTLVYESNTINDQSNEWTDISYYETVELNNVETGPRINNSVATDAIYRGQFSSVPTPTIPTFTSFSNNVFYRALASCQSN